MIALNTFSGSGLTAKKTAACGATQTAADQITRRRTLMMGKRRRVSNTHGNIGEHHHEQGHR